MRGGWGSGGGSNPAISWGKNPGAIPLSYRAPARAAGGWESNPDRGVPQAVGCQSTAALPLGSSPTAWGTGSEGEPRDTAYRLSSSCLTRRPSLAGGLSSPPGEGGATLIPFALFSCAAGESLHAGPVSDRIQLRPLSPAPSPAPKRRGAASTALSLTHRPSPWATSRDPACCAAVGVSSQRLRRRGSHPFTSIR